jgi:hypothetical protein
VRPRRIERAFTLTESGLVVLVTLRDGDRENVMTPLRLKRPDGA